MIKDKKPFFWGASTASHQVEGGTENQWSVFELGIAAESAKRATKRLDWLANWPEISQRALDPHNYVSGKGVDHYNRYEEDFDIVKKLNLNAFRFTVEWSRVEPQEGKFDAKAIDHYRTYIYELRNRGIEPFLNIWHWTEPVWFTEKGSFEKRANLKYFERFVEVITRELLVDVNYVITINEANSYATYGYLDGKWTPGHHKDVLGAIKVYYNLMLANKVAYKTIKKSRPDIQIGLAHQATDNRPTNEKNIWQKFTSKSANYIWHEWFYNRSRKYQDFIGFNYYFTNYINNFSLQNPKTPINDMGWYMEPYSIKRLIMSLHKKYKKPIIITENGVPDEHDQYRKWWIGETMLAIEDAKKSGADVAGYFHWSLLDNFEWDEGWWPKFGLVEVDREHGMKRTIRPSALWWAKEIKKYDI